MSATASMTGFASSADGDWVWEVRSVNHRGLDLRFRLPPGLDRLEPPARQAVRARFSRGSVTVSLSRGHGGGGRRYAVNGEWYEELRGLVAGGRARTAAGAEPEYDPGLLALRGVIEPVEDFADAPADAVLLASLERALAGLAEARRREGAELASALHALLAAMTELLSKARSTAATRPRALRAQLAAAVAALDTGLPEDRLAQEVALLAAKADIREELDRLGAHLEAAAGLLGGGGPVGRRLDFLCQELNREVNTLCSKSADIALTRVGLDLKAALESFREQVQNVE